MSRAAKAEVFRARLAGRPADVRQKATKLLNATTLRLYELIVSAAEHRVDTGRMRAGWAIATEKPTDYAPRKMSREESRERERARRAGQKMRPMFDVPDASGYAESLTAAPLEMKRVVFNNVEYAVFVELGTERREGQHVVRLAAQRLVAGVPKAATMTS